MFHKALALKWTTHCSRFTKTKLLELSVQLTSSDSERPLGVVPVFQFQTSFWGVDCSLYGEIGFFASCLEIDIVNISLIGAIGVRGERWFLICP